MKRTIEELRKRGYTVVISRAMTSGEFRSALYAQSTAGIFFNGHGAEDGEGSVKFSDGVVLTPDDIEAIKVSRSLKFLVMAACASGQVNWKAKMPDGVKVWAAGKRFSFDGTLNKFVSYRRWYNNRADDPLQNYTDVLR